MENLNELTDEQKISKATEFIASVQNPEIPIANMGLLEQQVAEALKDRAPLFFATITCPNWVVKDGVRSIAPIDEETLRPHFFFGQEFPLLLSGFKQLGFSTGVLIILSDIISPDWMKPSEELERNLAQNLVALKTISWSRAPSFGIGPNESPSTKAVISLQKPLVAKILEATELFQTNLDCTLKPSTIVGQLFLKIWTQFDQAQVYDDRRGDNTGLEKIRKRAAFLTALYATDGLLMPKMVQNTFRLKEIPQIIGMNLEMDIPFANALIWGWNALNNFPVITPTRNGTDWSGPIFI